MNTAEVSDRQPGGSSLESPSGTWIARSASTLATIGLSLVGLLAITFVIGRLLPADPVLAIVGDNASKDQYDQVFRQLHLDQPLWRQFAIYVDEILQGNFGQSRVTNDAVLNDILRFLPATFELATIAIAIGVIAGVPLGMGCALHANRSFDHVGRVISLLGHSFPVFWLGLVGLLVFYSKLGWVEGPGRIGLAYQYTVPEVTKLLLVDTLLSGDMDAFRDAVSHIVLPSAILGLAAIGYITRMTRTFLLWQMRQDYVTVCRLKGLADFTILWRHALPNTLGPIVAIIAMTYAHLLEGAVLTETVFAWPGLGLYITQSLFASDLSPVLIGTLVIGAIFMLFNSLAELFQHLSDPRGARV
ncbi:MAG: ABC transporter permease [Microvirga sp.]